MPGLEEKYAELRKLFVGWQGRDDLIGEQIRAMQAQGQIQNQHQNQSQMHTGGQNQQQANGGAVMGVSNALLGGTTGMVTM